MSHFVESNSAYSPKPKAQSPKPKAQSPKPKAQSQLTTRKPQNENSYRPWIHPRDQAGLYVLTACALALSLSYWFYLGGHRGQQIEIDRASPLEAKYVVDINSADWPEIIQLPGLGEVLAQRVVADRASKGPFRTVDELTRVDGIGVKTLEKIRPYLRSIPQDTDWAAAHGATTTLQLQ